MSVDAEMATRGIEFSVGLVGEKSAIDFFTSTAGFSNLIEAPKGAKNVDALSRDGERYSIKTQLKAKKTGTVYPDSENPDRQLFEHLLVVKLSQSYTLISIHRFSWDAFTKVRAWDKRMNAWYIPISKVRLKQAELIYKLQE